ncbi:MAG: ribonuclease III [Bdellovibrionaceae bacterium]|nr:ribonuclease III [Pseudobdellovibrionaceae bacterium]MBX3035125.1 ribonuclease III [Pseudobdellovibrionaceae bacterium]
MSLETRLQYEFRRPELLLQALTHKSFAYENRAAAHNEKLEFLGDAVIDLVLGEFLMDLFPGDEEGSLSKKRASLVNEETLAVLARRHELPAVLRLGKGEAQSGGAEKPRLLGSAWEALCGALYLDGGYEPVRELLRREFRPLIEQLDPEQDYAADYKTRVQELAQKLDRATPVYELVSEEGPPHDRVFTVSLKVKEEEIARGAGRSKKAAEQQAAREGLNNPRWGKGDKS